MHTHGLIIFLTFCVFAACTNDQQWQKLANQNFVYQYFPCDSSSENKIEFGDRIHFHYTLRKGNEIIESTYAHGQAVELVFPAKMERNQFMEPLALAAAGDSLVAKINYAEAKAELSSFKSHFREGDEAIFTYKIVSVETRAEQLLRSETRYAQEKGFASVTAMRQEKEQMQAKADSLSKALGTKAAACRAGILKLQATDNGLQALLHSKKVQTPFAKGDTVFLYYQLALLEDGIVFDDAFARGDRLMYVLGAPNSLPKLFELACLNAEPGTAATFRVPAAFAYGQGGSLPVVPPNADLLVYMEFVGASTQAKIPQ